MLCFAAALALLTAGGQVVGGRGTISGIVADSTGAVIPNAPVSITDTETNVTVLARSNDTGFYIARQLLPGIYRVTSEAPGFKKLTRDRLTVDADITVRVDLKLEVGAIDQEVVVSGQPSLLNTESGADPQILDKLTLGSVPSSGDNATLLLKLQPNVEASDPQNQYMGGSLHAGGAIQSLGTAGQYGVNEFSLDGAPNMVGHGSNYNSFNDEVEEISTDTSEFSATVGKTMGININTVSKNGTNNFHGSASAQYDDHKWQPLSHFSRIAYVNNVTDSGACGSPNENSTACDALKKQYGQLPLHDLLWNFTFGGAVVIPKLFDGHNKLFFFVGYIWNFYPDPLTGAATVPTTQEKTGNFSDLPCIVSGSGTTFTYSAGSCPNPATANFGQYAIYDPASTMPDPNHPGHYIRTAFPGNMVPSNRIQDPLASLLNKEFPAPNTPDSNGNYADTNNYTYDLNEPEWYTAISPRIDWTPTAKDRFFFRSARGRFDYIRPYCCQVDNIGELWNARQYFVMTGGWDHAFTTNLSMSSALGYSRYKGPAGYPKGTQYSAAGLGLPAYMDAQTVASGMSPVLPPTIATNTYAGLGYGSSTNPGYDKTMSIRSNLTWVHGAHTVQFGGELRIQQAVSYANGNANGTLTFDNTYTDVGDAPSLYFSTGASELGTTYAAFLMGYQTSASQYVGVPNHTSSPYTGYYVQENWRLNRKLTVNAGLRYEYEWAPVEAQNRQIVGFDPNQTLAISGPAQTAYAANLATYNSALPSGFSMPSSINTNGGAVYAGVNGAPRTLFDRSYRIMPRVAGAYQITSKTVFRIGYGLFFDTHNTQINNNDQTGYSITTSINSSNNSGQTYVANAAVPVLDPFPVNNGSRYLTPYGNILGNLVYAGGSQTFYPRDYAPPRQHRWQGSVQHQLDTHSLIQFVYEGSFTDHIGVNQNVDSVPAAYYTTGQVVNPNFGKLTANVANPFNIGNLSGLQSSNPNAYTYLSKIGYFTSSTIALDNLLKPHPQLSGLTEATTLGKSWFNDFEVLYRRRFGSNLDASIDYTRTFQYDKTFFANTYDSEPSWIDDVSNSRPSRLIGTVVWKMPFGKKQKFANHGWKSAAFGGFQYGSTFEAQQGQLVTWGNVFFSGCTTSWKTCDTSSIKLPNPTYGKWFNTTGFSTTAPTALNARVFPDVIDGIRFIGLNNWNMNIQRSIPVSERATLDLRVEAMDVFNHLLVGGPNTSPSSAQFGQSTADLYGGQPNYGRFIQIRGRITF